jgi:hypothetical protein
MSKAHHFRGGGFLVGSSSFVVDFHPSMELEKNQLGREINRVSTGERMEKEVR